MKKIEKLPSNAKYTPELAEEICRRISVGQSLVTISRDPLMPGTTTIRNWILNNKDFKAAYDLARDEQADFYADEIIEIADASYRTGEQIQQARLKIDSRKWIASKLKPKRYGEKVDLTTDGEKLEPLVIYRPDKLPRIIDLETEDTTKQLDSGE